MLADIGTLEAGASKLPRDLTINGQTVSPTFWYEGRNASTSDWVATVGQDLTGKGSGGAVGLACPTPSDVDRAAGGEETRYWDTDDADFADISTEDYVIEVVLKYKTGVQTAVLSKYTPLGNDSGYLLYTPSAGNMYLYTADDSILSGASVILTGLQEDVWYHLIYFIDRSGSGIGYANGSPGSAVVVSGFPNCSTVNEFRINAFADAAGKGSQELAHAAMWKRDDWLDTHLQADLAEERFARLTGTYVPAWGKGPTQSLLRNSVATLEKRAPDGIQQLFTVGPRWPRVEQGRDKAGRYGSGVRSEAQHTNVLKWSEDFDNAVWDTTWALAASASPNVAVAPDGETTADAIHEDATAASQHYLGQNFGSTVAGEPYVLQCFVSPAFRRNIRLRNSSVQAIADFDVAAGVVINEDKNDYAGIRYLGNGIYLCWMKWTGISSGGVAQIIVLDDNGNDVFDGQDQDSLYLWGAQQVNFDQPVSYIKTEGATVTRLADVCKYESIALSPRGSLALDFWHVDTDTGLVYPASLGPNPDQVSAILSASGDPFRTQVRVGGSVTADIIGTTDVSDDLWHELRITYETDNVRIYVDGEADGSDTDAAISNIMDEFSLGHAFSGSAQINGLVRARLLSAPTLNDITDFGDIMSKASGYISSAAAVAQSTSYANVGGTFTSVDLLDFTLSAGGVLTYTGADTKRFVITAACSGSISSGTPEVTTTIEKNGTEVAASNSKRDVSTTGIGAWAVTGDIELANGDTINFATKVDTGTPNLTMEALTFTVHEF